VIVEVPLEPDQYASVWNDVMDFCKDRQRTRKIKPGSTVNFLSFPKVTVTGYAFYDASHWSKNDQQRGVNHGTKYVATIWELHPVVQFRSAQ
jgi:hypothetical protein